MLPYVEGAKVEENEEERPHSPSYYDKKERRIKWTDRILLSRPLKVVFVMLILAIFLPLLLYSYILSSTLDLPPEDEFSHGSCVLPRSSRLWCGIGNVTISQCHPECCYDISNDICYHRIPSRFSYISQDNWTEDVNFTARISTEPFSGTATIETLRLSIDEVSSTHMTLTFYDPNSTPPMQGRRREQKDYNYEISREELVINVYRSTALIFSTIRGPLIAAKNIWEIAFKLTDDAMFGLGRIPLLANTTRVLYSNRESPDIIPLIYAKINGTYHGVLIDNATPIELSVFHDNQLIARLIEKHSLKIHIFVGPEPKDIMRDVMDLIGFENNLKYWMLGVHICTEVDESYEDALEGLTEFLTEARAQNLPFDSHCGSKSIIFDTVCDKSFSYVEKGKELIKNEGIKFVPHLSPYILYKNITKETSSEETTIPNNTSAYNNSCYFKNIDVYKQLIIRDPNSKKWYSGLADGSSVLYPDYRSENSSDFIKNFWRIGDFDGIILQNTWPQDETYKTFNATTLPYFNENFEEAFSNTIPWNAVDSEGKLYMYRHNEYGNNFYKVMRSLAGSRNPVWSTGHRMNGNVINNRQNKDTSWANLHRELIDAALAGVSGNRYWASPICGDTENFNTTTQTSLCTKWYMASTYMPLIKIHSKKKLRHPLAFTGTSRRHIVNALRRRYSLLPYFYTVLQTGPLLRPMFYQYPKFEYLANINTQFNVGDDLLIIPNLLPGQSMVHVWVPPGQWYEMWSGITLEHEEDNPVSMSTTEADFLTLIRGGAILLLQQDIKRTAEGTRKESPYTAIIALECHSSLGSSLSSNKTCHAEGKLYISKNITLLLTSDADSLKIQRDVDDANYLCEEETASSNILNDMKIYGLGQKHNNHDFYKYINNVELNLCSSSELNYENFS